MLGLLVADVVVVEQAVVGIRRRVQVKNALRDGVDLLGTEHILLPVARQQRRPVASGLVTA